MYRERKQTKLKGRYCEKCLIFYPSNRTGHIVDCPKCFGPLSKLAGVAKYRNRKEEWRGKMIDSKKERDVLIEQEYLLKAGEIKGFRSQVAFPLYVNDYLITTYIADIVVEHNDGTTEIIEVKSKITDRIPTWRIKRNLLEATYLVDHLDWRLTVLK